MALSHHFNDQRLSGESELDAAKCVQNLAGADEAVNTIREWPEYSPQPLHTLKHTAKQVGIKDIFFKDESMRFGASLGSFKALGAPYATYKILAEEVHSRTHVYPSPADLRSGKFSDITRRVTVCVATDGNQGRGLAYGAQIFGCRCVVYIHRHVSEPRADAMKDLHATVIRVDGEYELSVRRAKEDARMNGWHFVSSTSWTDFDHPIPQNVMKAYTVVVEEALDLVPANAVSHVFVCGGVGSIAAAIFLGFYRRWKSNCKAGQNGPLPRFVLVEPTEADCLHQSLKRRELTSSKGSLQTIMAGLACWEPSPAALKILLWLASDSITVPDSFAEEGMRALASG